MDTIFMNSENSETSKPHVLKLKLTTKLDLKVAGKVIDHIGTLQESIPNHPNNFEILTVAVTSTPTLSRIYHRAFDGIIPVEGISSPSFVGTDPKAKGSVTRT